MSRRNLTYAASLLGPGVLIIGGALWLLKLTSDMPGKAFYIPQALILLGLVLLWAFYRRIIRPINAISTGIDLLRGQDFNSRMSRVGQKDTDHIVGMFNDIIERLSRERLHVREQNQFLDLLIEASPMGIVVLDFDDKISMANNAAANIFGCRRDSLSGKKLSEIPQAAAASLHTLQPNETRTLRLNSAMVLKVSRLRYMDRGFSHPFILMERLTDEVIRAERQAYEKVIRMMAHEVNNSMASVDSILDTASDCIADPELAEALDACRRRCASMSRFVTSFASVVKIPQPTLRAVSLNEFVSGCRVVLENLCMGRNISLRIVESADDVSAQLDSAMMEQVLINIVKNSAESIGHGGEVAVRVTDSPAGLVIEDNGAGLSAEAAERVFTPFYSSKWEGRGLGLLLVRDVLRKHQADFSLQTCPDGITRFTISFLKV